MGIDGKGGDFKDVRKYDIGRFAAYTGKGFEFLAFARNLSMILGIQYLGQFKNGLRFARIQSAWFDDLFDFFSSEGCNFGRCRAVFPELRRNLVDAFVSTLSRQDDGNEQRIGA